MTRRTRWLLIAAVVALTLGGIFGRMLMSRRAPPPLVPGAAQVALPVELAPGDVVVAERSELVAQLAITGSLKAVDSAVVKARVAAEVKTLAVREGDRVSAGQLLGRLDDTEYRLKLRQAEDQAAAAQAQLDIAQRGYDNNRALVEQGFISRNALDTSASNTSGARASLQAAQAAADLARKAVRDSEIRAPIAGLVAMRAVQPGERVGIDAKLIEIVDLSRVELEAAVPPEDVLAMRVGQAARVAIDGLAEPVAARVVRINPSASTGTRSVMAYLALANTPGLRQGLFARASIDLQRKTALLVPAAALRFEQARPYVLTVEGGVATQREVSVGARGDARFGGRADSAVEITQGLEPGAVVLRGTVGAMRAGTRLRLPPAAATGGPGGANAAAATAATAAR